METKDLLDFDELKIFYEYDYSPVDKIKIRQPKIQEIIDYGDNKFYSMLNSICGNPTMFRLQLWNVGINWNDISDFDFFSMMIKNFTPKDTSILFGDLNLSWFERFHDNESDSSVLIYVPHDEDDEPINIFELDKEELIKIDEIVYIKFVEYLRFMFNINPKVEHAKNKITAEAIIWEEEENLKIEQKKHKDDKVKKSALLPMISFALNHPGFKYKKSELKDVGIFEFMNSVKSLQSYEATRALLTGTYSGMVDTSKIPKEEFNFIK